MTTKTIDFDVYRDVTPYDDDDLFAVLRNPGPDTPKGTLADVQAKVEATDAFDDLDDGDAVEPAGEVEYRPGKEDGEVVDVRFRGDDR